MSFYRSGINDKDHDAASKPLGDRHVQHNPRIADGPEVFFRLENGML
jgi:predicted SnoaL-like aldol condensation-catalyzing enzyme